MTLDLHQCSRTGKSSWRAAWNGSKRTRSPTRMRWSLTRGRGHGSWGWHLTATTSWWPRTPTTGSIEAPDVLAVANKWRHWKPGKIKTQLPTSQRALEQHLRARWLERLLGYFIPFRHQIPYMHQVMGASLATSLVMPGSVPSGHTAWPMRACARSAYRTSPERPATSGTS